MAHGGDFDRARSSNVGDSLPWIPPQAAIDGARAHRIRCPANWPKRQQAQCSSGQPGTRGIEIAQAISVSAIQGRHRRRRTLPRDGPASLRFQPRGKVGYEFCKARPRPDRLRFAIPAFPSGGWRHAVRWPTSWHPDCDRWRCTFHPPRLRKRRFPRSDRRNDIVGATAPCRYASRNDSTPLGVANLSICGIGFRLKEWA